MARRIARRITEFVEPSDDEIAGYAYMIFDHDGKIPGRELENWLQAEAQIIAVRRHDAGLPCVPELLHRGPKDK